MPGYIKKVLQKYKPLDPPNTQHAPYTTPQQKLERPRRNRNRSMNPPRQQRRKSYEFNKSWAEFILCPSGGPHRPHVALQDHERAIRGHKDKNNKHEAIVRLFGNPSKCNNEVLCLQHDNEHPFRCILPFHQGHYKTCIWKFSHGFLPKGRQTNFPQRRILIHLCHPEVRCIISSGGRVRHIFHEHEGGENIPSYLKRAQTSATTNVNSLR